MHDPEQGFRKIAASYPQPGALPTVSQHSTDPQTAATRALMLLGCYRKGDAEDPDTYATAVAAVLSQYPADVVQRVTDPRTGIAGRSKFLPTVSEVREACEAASAAADRAAKRARDLAAQVAREQESLRFERERASRPTSEQLAAVHGLDQRRRAAADAQALDTALRTAAQERKAETARAALEQREREVLMDWGDEPAPTIAGVPISRELHALVQRQRGGG